MTLAFYLGLTLFEEMALAPAAPVGMAMPPTASVTKVQAAELLAGFGSSGWLRHNRAREKKWPWLAVLAAIGVYQKESAGWRSMISPGPNRTGPAYACAAIPSAGFAWARTHALHGAGAVRAPVHGPRWPLPAFGRPSGGGEGDRKLPAIADLAGWVIVRLDVQRSAGLGGVTPARCALLVCAGAARQRSVSGDNTAYGSSRQVLLAACRRSRTW
jgi:hypothetical protein